MARLAALREYAGKADLTSLPADVLLSHTEKTMTIFDAYPKSLWHFLVLPRIHRVTQPNNLTGDSNSTNETFSSQDLSNLTTLLKLGRSRAKQQLLLLKEEGLRCKEHIQKEMIKSYGFSWEVWMGFHAIPSMEHLHLHVLSGDLRKDTMKTKKHYNSFHPTLGFFLHIDHVISWCDVEEPKFKELSSLKSSKYEGLLKQNLNCFYCEERMKNMPILKSHLNTEFQRLEKREKNAQIKSETDDAASRKRKRVTEGSISDDSEVSTGSVKNVETSQNKRIKDKT